MVELNTITFYKIICLDTGKTYIGSTKVALKRRMQMHVANMKCYNKGTQGKCSSFDIICNDNYIVKELSVQTVSNKKRKRLEKKLIKTELGKGICVNKNIPSRGRKEYVEVKRDYINNYMRMRYAKNEDARLYKKEYYHRVKNSKPKWYCETCKKNINAFNIKPHKKSKKHLAHSVV